MDSAHNPARLSPSDGQGSGKRLLEEAENIARSKRCTFIKLNTFSFQAPSNSFEEVINIVNHYIPTSAGGFSEW